MIDAVTGVLKFIAFAGFVTAGGIALLRWNGERAGIPAYLFSFTAFILGIVCGFNWLNGAGIDFFEAYEGYLEILIFPMALFWVYTTRSARHQRMMGAMHAEQVLRGALLNAVQDSVILNDLDGRILYANDAALHTRGYSRETVPLRHVNDLEEETGAERTAVDRFRLSESGASRFEAIHRRRDGSSFPVEIHAKLIDHNGSSAVLSVVRDISERRRAESERKEMLLRLQQVEKVEALASLAGGIAHDFNNILVPILGYGELLLKEAQPGSDAFVASSSIINAAERAADIIQQIRTLRSNPTEEPVPILVHLHVVVREVVRLLSKVLPSTVELTTDISPNCPPVLTTASDIHRISMNLVTNAHQSLRTKPGSIKVSLSFEGADDKGHSDEVVLVVTDTGQGIGPDAMSRIFDPYFSTKGDLGGTGLGLAVVESLVRRAGGNVSVDSKVGEGSRFCVRFPAARSVTEDAGSVSDEMAEFVGDGHVLLVDDDSAVVAFTETVLRKAGYRVTAFTSSTSALEAYEEAPALFDVILSDVTMPKMTGDMLMKRVRSIELGTPVILATGNTSRLSEEQARKMGAADYLIKPARAKRLLEAVGGTLSKRRALLKTTGGVAASAESEASRDR